MEAYVAALNKMDSESETGRLEVGLTWHLLGDQRRSAGMSKRFVA